MDSTHQGVLQQSVHRLAHQLHSQLEGKKSDSAKLTKCAESYFCITLEISWVITKKFTDCSGQIQPPCSPRKAKKRRTHSASTGGGVRKQRGRWNEVRGGRERASPWVDQPGEGDGARIWYLGQILTPTLVEPIILLMQLQVALSRLLGHYYILLHLSCATRQSGFLIPGLGLSCKSSIQNTHWVGTSPLHQPGSVTNIGHNLMYTYDSSGGG